MNYIIRAALFALSLATITPVANAAAIHNPGSGNNAPADTSTPAYQDSTADWVNG